jgi:6-phosphogluconolactonase (cycloisomerase 2 family)
MRGIPRLVTAAAAACALLLGCRDPFMDRVAAAVTSAGGAVAVLPPVMSPEGGTVGHARGITLSAATGGSVIRYTTDGTEPTAASAQYASAFTVGYGLTEVRAKAFLGSQESRTVRAYFTVPVYVYIACAGSDTINAYSLHPADRTLSPVGAGSYSVAADPVALAADPQGRWLFAASVNVSYQSSISVFSIDAATGALTLENVLSMPPAYVTTGLTVAPSGKYLYVTNSNPHRLSVHSIDQTTGAASAILTEYFVSYPAAVRAVSTSSGTYVYVAGGSASGYVHWYQVQADGSLADRTQVTGMTDPVSVAIAVNGGGTYLYTANNGTSDISMFTVNTATGALTAGPVYASGGLAPVSISIDSAGFRMHLANSASPSINGFQIAADGTLTTYGVPLTGASSPPAPASSVAMDPTDDVVVSVGGSGGGSAVTCQYDLSNPGVKATGLSTPCAVVITGPAQ